MKSDRMKNWSKEEWPQERLLAEGGDELTSDDGTARDKVARIKVLETQRNQHIGEGHRSYEVVSCIDGRGFRERREDIRQSLQRLQGKVLTMTTLDQLVTHTRIREFVTLFA